MIDYSADTPYSSYDEIVKAVRNGEAKFSYQRSAANSIFGLRHPILSLFLFYLGFVFGLGVLLIFSIMQNFYWILLFAPVCFILNTMVAHLRKLIFSVGFLACVVAFILEVSWLFPIGLSLFATIIGYEIWWAIVSSSAHKALISSSELFEQAWTAGVIAIKSGNGFYTSSYSKERLKDMLK